MDINKDEIKENETATVSFCIKNAGNLAGKEIVQLYTHDDVSSIPCPEIELRHFAKIELQPGEEKKVTFELDFRDIAYYDIDMKRYAAIGDAMSDEKAWPKMRELAM